MRKKPFFWFKTVFQAFKTVFFLFFFPIRKVLICQQHDLQKKASPNASHPSFFQVSIVCQKELLIHGQFKLHSNTDNTTGNKLVNHPPLISFNCKGQVECKHCEHILSDSNTMCKKQHLIQSYPKFLNHYRSKDINNFLTKLIDECEDDQQKLNFPSIPPSNKERFGSRVRQSLLYSCSSIQSL